MGEAAEGGSKALRNWMGEPRQDDEERTLQLSLGLPGGGGGGGATWTAAGREKGNHHHHSAADTSMLSLGYSNAAAFSPCSQGM
jgi:auxin-responsive protein IAA